MSPHLVTAPAEEAYRSPESRLADLEPSRATGLTAQQVSDLLIGHRRSVRRMQVSCWDRRLQARLARRRARQGYWTAAVARTGSAVERARDDLGSTPACRRPFGRLGAFLATALLMLASSSPSAAFSPAPICLRWRPGCCRWRLGRSSSWRPKPQ